MSRQSAIDSHRDGAEVHTGVALCKRKAEELLAELHLPKGLLPLTDIEEMGYNRSTGFVWFRRKKPTIYTFKKAGRTSWLAPEVTALVEDRRMRKLTGVTGKEKMMWFAVAELFIDDKDPARITFKGRMGLSRSFPVSAFEEEEAAAAGGK